MRNCESWVDKPILVSRSIEEDGRKTEGRKRIKIYVNIGICGSCSVGETSKGDIGKQACRNYWKYHGGPCLEDTQWCFYCYQPGHYKRSCVLLNRGVYKSSWRKNMD